MKSFEQLRIIFFGTPGFAVATLDALVQAGANVVAVVTAPDKQAGRGLQMQAPAVKEYAASKAIPVLQPEKLKNAQFLQQLALYEADVQVVVAFRMLPEVVWNMPPMGTINVHASLLPQYRGAAPINWAIINGEAETGVSTFKLQHAIDTGNILLQEKVAILPEDNAGTLHDKLMITGAALLVTTLKQLTGAGIAEMQQNNIPEDQLKHAPKIFKEYLRIDWTKPAADIHNFIRGMAPYPTAFTVLKDKTLKVYKAHYQNEAHTVEPATYETDGTSYLRYAAADGWVYIDDLQLEGKKQMDVISFLRGFRP